jgi:hypothetical protein
MSCEYKSIENLKLSGSYYFHSSISQEKSFFKYSSFHSFDTLVEMFESYPYSSKIILRLDDTSSNHNCILYKYFSEYDPYVKVHSEYSSKGKQYLYFVTMNQPLEKNHSKSISNTDDISLTTTSFNTDDRFYIDNDAGDKSWGEVIRDTINDVMDKVLGSEGGVTTGSITTTTTKTFNSDGSSTTTTTTTGTTKTTTPAKNK